MALPPTCILTGPLSLPQTKLLAELEKKDPDLLKWLDEAQSAGQKVVYVSVGSVCIWQQWSINAIYYGLKKLGCRVIWSLKSELKLPEENPNFWVRQWIPQVEILAHPVLKAGLTHCGFGGTLEFIAAGKPIVAFPHFIDQIPNAAELEKRKVAVILHTKPDKFETDFEEMKTYRDEKFDDKKVYTVFKEILENPIYAENMQRLQKIQKSSGGRRLAVKTIEDVAEVGIDHLIDNSLIEKRKGLNWCLSGCGIFLAFAIVVTLVVFTTLYFVRINTIEDQYADGNRDTVIDDSVNDG